MSATLVIVLAFAAALLIGMPVAVALGVASIAAIMLLGLPLEYLAQNAFSAIDSFTLIAIPMFIFAGTLMERGRLTHDLINLSRAIVGDRPGGLGTVTVLGCSLFAAITGSGPATAAAIGSIMIPAMVKDNYSRSFATGLTASAGGLGVVIPPSIPMVVYAVSANVSVLQVFLGGFLPGVLVMALYMGYVIIWSLLNPDKSPPRDPSLPFRQKLRESAKLMPVLLLIAAVFFSLILGFATATECAAWGVTGALFLAWWSGTLTWQTFSESVMSATRLTCMIMLILAGAAFCTAAMAYTGIPAALAQWVKGQDLSPHMLVLALTCMYIILGCLIDGISMIVLTAVIVLPMVKEAGFDLIWFGVYLVIHVEMAQITPPVGFNLFVLQNMSGKDTWTVAKAAFPFFILLNIAVIIITTFPEIVLYLPKLAFPDH